MTKTTKVKCGICGRQENKKEITNLEVAARNGETKDFKRLNLCKYCKNKLWDLENSLFADVEVRDDFIVSCVDYTKNNLDNITSNEKDIKHAIKVNDTYGFESIDKSNLDIIER